MNPLVEAGANTLDVFANAIEARPPMTKAEIVEAARATARFMREAARS